MIHPSLELKVMVEICEATKCALDKGVYVTADKHDPASAEFWLRNFIDHVSQLRRGYEGDDDQFGQQLPQPLRDYPRFFVRALFSAKVNTVMTHLSQFADHFSTLIKMSLVFATPGTKMLLAMAETDFESLESPIDKAHVRARSQHHCIEIES